MNFLRALVFVPVLAGIVLGIGGWMLKTYADPNDDRLSASWQKSKGHTRSTMLALISYLGVCLTLPFGDSMVLNTVTCIGIAFTSQELFEAKFGPQ